MRVEAHPLVGGRVSGDQQGWSAPPVPVGDFACAGQRRLACSPLGVEGRSPPLVGGRVFAGQQGWPATLLALRVGAHPLVGGRVFAGQQGWPATPSTLRVEAHPWWEVVYSTTSGAGLLPLFRWVISFSTASEGWLAPLSALRVGAHPWWAVVCLPASRGWPAPPVPMGDFACAGQQGLACYPPWR
jgi:hypothetical protein